MAKNKKHKKSIYKRLLLIYTVILILIGLLFLNHVHGSLLLYDKYELDNFIKNNLQDGSIAKYYNSDFEANKLEKNDVNNKAVAAILKQDNIKAKRKSETDNKAEYEIYRDKQLIANVSLSATKSYKRIFILTIKEWKIDKVSFDFKDGFYQYKIDIPFTHNLYVNDVLVDDYETTNIKALDRVILYDQNVGRKVFKLNNFLNEPKIEIKDKDGNLVEYDKTKKDIVIENEFPKVAYKDLKLKGEIDVMQFAKNWSLFLTNNLGGSRNGLVKFLPYLITDSYMYSIAARWAKGPEIYDNPPHKVTGFTNDEVVSCTVYSEDSFSCEIKLEKNIVLTKTGAKRVDKMHENLFFTFYAGGYKLTDMQSM